MNDADQLAFFRRVLTAFDGFKNADSSDLLWLMDRTPPAFFARCGDTFWWGCADVEEITPANITVLEQAIADCRAADPVVGVCAAAELFAARVRGMRPQGAAYPAEKSLWPLFDACGPEREVGDGNPRPHPSRQATATQEKCDE